MNTIKDNTPQMPPRSQESDTAFQRAIDEDVLNSAPYHPRYAGKYMYMHSDAAGDYFKNIDTRRYLLSPGRTPGAGP